MNSKKANFTKQNQKVFRVSLAYDLAAKTFSGTHVNDLCGTYVDGKHVFLSHN